MLQSSQYSIYNTFFESQLKAIYAECGVTGPTDILPSILPPRTTSSYCLSDQFYTASTGDTCDTIAMAFNVSSAAIYNANSNSTFGITCSAVIPGTTLCLPLPCAEVYTFNANDTCTSIEQANSLAPGTVRNLNAWIQYACTNIQITNAIYGNVVCLAPLGGTFIPTVIAANSTTEPVPITGYSLQALAPPANVTVAQGTTLNCGAWYVAIDGDTCANIDVEAGITAGLFLLVNPSLASGADCTAGLVNGSAYCVGPTYEWNMTSTTTASAIPSVSLATAIPTSTKYTQLGCYIEPNTTDDGTSIYDYADMSLDVCATFCADQYPLFGVADGGLCYCANDPAAPYAVSDSTNCYIDCPANTAQNCGGDGYLNMFSLTNPSSSSSNISITTSATATLQTASLTASATGLALPTAVASAGKFTSLGCWTDSPESRALFAAAAYSETIMTIEYCASYCASYIYFGTERAFNCYCGDTLSDAPTLAPAADCSTACSGNAGEQCGAIGRMNLYQAM